MPKGIKRHPCLQPLSRDHLIALMGAQRLMKAGRKEISFEEGTEFFQTVWQNEITQHLIDEENILPEFIKETGDLDRLLGDHEKLRAYQKQLEGLRSCTTNNVEKAEEMTAQKPSDEALKLALEAGNFLDSHIRWEEREFFPRLENTCSKEEIEKLLRLTDEVEQKRERGKSCEPRKNTKKRNNPKN